MQRFRLSLLATSICALCFSEASFAAAYQLYEVGAPVVGAADVGQAIVNDASSSYFNPAAMTQLRSTEFLIGSQLISPHIKFSPNAQTTISGDNGGNAGSLTPGVGMFYVYSFSPKLKFGVNLTAPYGGMLNYTDGWVGRYIVQYMQFYTLALNPAFAYKINDKFSVGGGVTVEYANLQQTVALPIDPALGIDGQANIKVDNIAPGFNLGALYTPTTTSRLGLAYRSKISHNLHGNLTFLRLAFTPSTSTTLIMPQNVIFSVSQDLSQSIALIGELGWANWAQMKNSTLSVAGYSATTPLNWNNTYRLGLSGQLKCTPALMLQLGASYDSSPTSTSHRVPNLPFDRQVRAGAGIVYSMMRSARVGLSYEYINFGRANINLSSPEGVLAGSYPTNYANVVQASINVDL